MKPARLPKAIVVTSWLATLSLAVVWVACPSQRFLTAQEPASPTPAAGTAPAHANPTAASGNADLAAQIDPNLQVLTQGSVHEAFGQPVLFNPGPSPVIAKQPADPVDELPPDTKPAGNNVQWIPGYWSFEAAQQKFVWTSGIWRVIPPGLAWVPGYWTQSGTGYQWISGFWRRSETAVASASFGTQLGTSGLANPAAGNPADIAKAASAAGPTPTSIPTVSAPVATPISAAGTNPVAGGQDNREAFFDSQIRPVLLGTCAKCHGSKKRSNNLRLDSQAGLLKGGDSGPAVVAGDPEKSLLIQAVRYTGEPKMPPNKKLPATVIADFERWVRDGAVFPEGVRPSAPQPVQKGDPTTSTATPVADAAVIVPGSAPASADAPVAAPPAAAAGESPNLGAVPGLVPTTPDTTPGSTRDPAPVVAGAAPIAVPGDASAASAPPANPQPTNLGADPATGASYVPRPPASLESGPVGNPPTADFVWIPGTWIYRHGRFLWLAGQWGPIHRGWVWVPARYVSTPAGYLFVDGFWDYELARRGVLFAPITLRPGYHGWGFSYTPSVVLNTNLLTNFLFVNSTCGCYCFGDYFRANHAQAGIFPGFAFHMSSLGYDPFFAFSSWSHHGDVGWHERLVTDFRAFRSGDRPPLPHTFDELVTRGRGTEGRSELLALPFSRFVAGTGLSPFRFVTVSSAERGEIDRSLRRSREATNRRSEFETRLSRREPTDRESRFTDNRRNSRTKDDRRDSRITNDRRDTRESKVADDRRESRTTDDRRDSRDNRRDSRDDRRDSRESKVADDRRDRTDQTASRDRTTNRTPPVVSRRPVSTAGLGHGTQESPDQRLANPKFVPRAANRGRSEVVIKGSSNGRR